MSEAGTSRKGRMRVAVGTISSPAGGAASAAAAAGTVELKEPLPRAGERGKMTIAAIKRWFTINELMDSEFEGLFRDSKAGKAKWVDYLNRRAAALGL
jgi:hypothetical protein